MNGWICVGKTTLLNRIANWEDLEGFPRHLRVLHVKQELTTENEETAVLDAVLEADIERVMLLKEEKELTPGELLNLKRKKGVRSFGRMTNLGILVFYIFLEQITSLVICSSLGTRCAKA